MGRFFIFGFIQTEPRFLRGFFIGPRSSRGRP